MKLRRPGRLGPFGFIVLGLNTPGSPIVAISLQEAYDGGHTIDESAKVQPVMISNGAAAVAALVQITATANALALQLQQQTAQHAISAEMDASAFGFAGLNVVSSNMVQQVITRVQNELGTLETLMTGSVLRFCSGGNSDTVEDVWIEVGDGQPQAIGLRITTGIGDTGAQCGQIQVGFDAYGAIRGGFMLEPDTGRMRLRVHQLDETGEGAPIRTGTLRLHNLTADEEENQPAAEDGDVHYRNEQSTGPQLNKGFRAFRDGAYGLVARGYQLPFADGNLSGVFLAVPHMLDTLAPIVQVYNEAGVLVVHGPGGWLGTAVDSNNYELELDAAVLPLTGTWYVTVLGF